jgi:hypothetical protein
MSGPRILNMVRKGRAFRYGAMNAREGWYCGARMKENGTRGMGIAMSGVGGVNVQPRDWRRSAAPEEDVDARLPCYDRIPFEYLVHR